MRNRRMALVGLALLHVAVVLNLFMCRMALPYIRTSFDMKADAAAWVITIYTLPYLVVMPLYGTLGDRMGKWRVFLAGIGVFLLGTVVNLVSGGLPWLLVGRAIQGAGAGGEVPLAIAMISDIFPADRQGRALGVWNAVGPLTGVVGTLAAGVLIDALHWRVVFVPILVVGLMALFLVWRLAPTTSRSVRFRSLSGLDWIGAILLGLLLTTILFYISSESITGLRSLQDWRLLCAALVTFGGFIVWERRQARPFVDLEMFSRKTLMRASFCAAIRMFTMNGLTFLMPLYLTDVRGLRATSTGLVLIAFYIGLIPAMYLGGRLVDRWGERWPLVGGMALQLATMVYFALLGGEPAQTIIALGLSAHGLGAGLSQSALHRKALEGLPSSQMGAASGLYSMIRFSGQLLGPAVAGILLQQGVERGLGSVAAYQLGFWLVAALSLPGVIVGLTIRNARQRVAHATQQPTS